MEKNNTNGKIILIVLLVIIIFIVSCTDNSKIIPEENNKNSNENSVISGFETISSGTTETGDVLIELRPHAFDNGKLNVDFSANTHSVDLSQFDLMQITTLEYDGNVLKPTSALTLAGHHNSGTLVFDTGKELNSFKIVIKSIPDIEERIFEWS